MKWRPEWFIIAVMTLIIFLQKQCCNEKEKAQRPVTVIHDTMPGDTVLRIVGRRIPVPVYIDSIREILVTLPADTAAILRDYFSRIFYSDTIRDSSFVAVINDTISRNRIVWREFQVQNLRPVAITTIIPADKQRRELYIGLKTGGNKDSFLFGPSVMCRGRKNTALSYSFDLMARTHQIGFFQKISLRR